jgi:hypothetical protein
VFVRSISSARGAISEAAKPRTVSRIASAGLAEIEVELARIPQHCVLPKGRFRPF